MIESGENANWLPAPTEIECIEPEEEEVDVGVVVALAAFVVVEEPPLLYCASANAGRARSAADRRVIVTVFDIR